MDITRHEDKMRLEEGEVAYLSFALYKKQFNKQITLLKKI